MGTTHRTHRGQRDQRQGEDTMTRTPRHRIAVGLLGAYLGGVALLGATTAAAEDLAAGTIQQTSQIGSASGETDNGDREEPTAVPLPAAPTPTTATAPTATGSPAADTQTGHETDEP